MKPIKKIQMGKNGLSSAFVSQVQSIFEDDEILKVAILKSHCRDKKEAVGIFDSLMEQLGPKFAYRLVGYVATVRKFRKEQR